MPNQEAVAQVQANIKTRLQQESGKLKEDVLQSISDLVKLANGEHEGSYVDTAWETLQLLEKEEFKLEELKQFWMKLFGNGDGVLGRFTFEICEKDTAKIKDGDSDKLDKAMKIKVVEMKTP